MQRYFFHLVSRDHRVLDHLGREMESLCDAYEFALRLFRKSGAYLAPEDFEGWRINVAKVDGHVELVVLFPKCSSDHAVGTTLEGASRAPNERGIRSPRSTR
jgi:prepilin-type processing-associated H-X9-DG protein